MEQKIKDGLTLEAALEQYEPMVHHFANAANTNYVCNKEDLEQEGRMAIIKAFETYDPGKGTCFTTWVQHHIKGAILDFQKHNLSCLSGGCYLQQVMRDLGPEATLEDYQKRNMRTNTIQAMGYINNTFAVSNYDELEIVSDNAINLDFTFQLVDWRSYLSEEEIYIVENYYGFNGEPQTFEVIGEHIGVSRKTASNKLKAALNKLRKIPGIEYYA